MLNEPDSNLKKSRSQGRSRSNSPILIDKRPVKINTEALNSKELSSLRVTPKSNRFKKEQSGSIIELGKMKNMITFNGSIREATSKFSISKATDLRQFIRKAKVYDSQSDDELEEIMQIEKKHSGLSVEIKYFFDIIIYVALLSAVAGQSLEIGFGMYKQKLHILSLLVELVFILDFILGFTWNYIDINDVEIKDIRKSAKRYLVTYFGLDLISALPISTYYNMKYIDTSTEALEWKGKQIKLASLCLKLLKLVKFSFSKDFTISQSFSYIRTSFDISKDNLNILQFVLYFFLLSHFLTCLWIWIACIDYPNWISNLNQNNLSNLDIYISSLYFNFTAIFTIGYGDIMGISLAERSYQMLLMIFGMVLYTLIISNISNLFKANEEENLHRDFMFDFLENSRIKYEIKEDLYLRFKRYLVAKFNPKVNKNLLLKGLPSSIQNELTCIVYEDIIHLFKFFKPIKLYEDGHFFVSQPEFAVRVITSLNPLKAYKNEYLIQEGEVVEEMIFIRQGIISVETSNFKLINLYKGEHFGEVNMLLNTKCSFSLRVKSRKSELFLLSKYDLISISKDFHAILETVHFTSAFNLEVMNTLTLMDHQGNILSSRSKTNIPTAHTQSPTIVGKIEGSKVSLNRCLDYFENEDLRAKNKRVSLSSNGSSSDGSVENNQNDKLNVIEEKEEDCQDNESKTEKSVSCTDEQAQYVKSASLNNLKSNDFMKATTTFLEKAKEAATRQAVVSSDNKSSSNCLKSCSSKNFSKNNTLSSGRLNFLSRAFESSQVDTSKAKQNQRLPKIKESKLRRNTRVATLGIKKNIEMSNNRISNPTKFFKENFTNWIKGRKNNSQDGKILSLESELDSIIDALENYVLLSN